MATSCCVYICICFVVMQIVSSPVTTVVGRKLTDDTILIYRNKVQQMFYHAYDNYLRNAYPYDELRPLSCDGVDTWGSFSLTLIDALDTLAVMGNYSEFRRVAQLIIDRANFDTNINVSVFETNIRVVGGLLSAHLFSRRVGMALEPGWPCSGPLLRLAESVARRLLPAFDTDTGMPYGTVNLRYGVPVGETTVTCTAGVTTYLVEFGTLSRLTGDPVFESVALKALNSMWELRSSIGLVGNHIDVMTGKWTAVDSGIGAGVDSYYEYLVKSAILFQKPELMSMFNEYRKAINKFVMHDDWYMWVNMEKGQVTLPIFQSLEAFWPGLLTLVGDLDAALKSIHNYHQVWKQFGFTPEFYNIPQSEPNNNREGYPLRPELIESIFYLYKATKDPLFLQFGIDIVESINYSAKTDCGFATVKDVRIHMIEDRMESFFLAETTKYLYLLFDQDNFLHSDGSKGHVIHTTHGDCVLEAGGYVFNTEAHPIDAAAVYCCSVAKEEDAVLQQFHDNMDLLSLLGLDNGDVLKPFQRKRRSNRATVKSFEVANDHDEPRMSVLLAPIFSDIFAKEIKSVETVTPSPIRDGIIEESNPIVVQSKVVTEDNRFETNSPGLASHLTVSDVEFSTRESMLNQTFGELFTDLNTGDIEENVVRNSEAEQKSVQGVGAGQVTYLGELDEEPDIRPDRKCGDGGEVGDSISSENNQKFNWEKEKITSGTFWTGTKPILNNVQRDTLRSSGFLDLATVTLSGVERNTSSRCQQTYVQVDYDVMRCPALPFILRFSVMGEMFGVNEKTVG